MSWMNARQRARVECEGSKEKGPVPHRKLYRNRLSLCAGSALAAFISRRRNNRPLPGCKTCAWTPMSSRKAYWGSMNGYETFFDCLCYVYRHWDTSNETSFPILCLISCHSKGHLFLFQATQIHSTCSCEFSTSSLNTDRHSECENAHHISCISIVLPWK